MAEMWITMGPQHPMTHGLWTLRVKVDGETVTDTEAELGYIHRGVEKICESRDFTQITPYCDRLCYVSAMTWAHSYIMAAEDLLVDDGRHRQAVEAVREGLPHLDVVPSFAFVVEAVNSIDRGALVVAPQDEKVLRVFDLEREE